MEAKILGVATLAMEDRRIMRAVLPVIPPIGTVVRCAGADLYVWNTATQLVLCRSIVWIDESDHAVERYSAPERMPAGLERLAKTNRLRGLPERIVLVLEPERPDERTVGA